MHLWGAYTHRALKRAEPWHSAIVQPRGKKLVVGCSRYERALRRVGQPPESTREQVIVRGRTGPRGGFYRHARAARRNERNHSLHLVVMIMIMLAIRHCAA